MTEKEMIEEMAETLYENRPYSELWWEDALEIAEILVKKGYRKIPEGARIILPVDGKAQVFLLTKKEYSDYLILKNNYARLLKKQFGVEVEE